MQASELREPVTRYRQAMKITNERWLEALAFFSAQYTKTADALERCLPACWPEEPYLHPRRACRDRRRGRNASVSRPLRGGLVRPRGSTQWSRIGSSTRFRSSSDRHTSRCTRIASRKTRGAWGWLPPRIPLHREGARPQKLACSFTRHLSKCHADAGFPIANRGVD